MNLIELTEKLIKFPSYTGNNEAINQCLEFCINYFRNNSKIFIKREQKNGVKSVLLSNIGTLDFDVLEVGHIDVVPATSNDMFIPKIINNIIYGRGTGDMKGFVAVAMKIFEYIIENKLNLKYGLLIVSDEEPGGFDGAKYWAEELGLKTKILLDADAGGALNTIIYKAKACYFAKLIAKGKSAHGSMPWLAIDANENLLNSILNLRKTFPYICEKSNIKDKWITTMHAGLINGGQAINAISNYAEAILDFRYTNEYNNHSLFKIIKESLEEGVEFIVQEEGIPIFNDKNNKYLQLYKREIEDITGKEADFNFATGASDARYFSNPNTVIISNQADCGNIHSDGEWLNLDQQERFYQVRAGFLKNLAGIFF